MKRFAAVCAIVVLAGFSVAGACDMEKGAAQAAVNTDNATKEVSLVGYLTDSNCGKANAHAEGKKCALKCIQGGAKVQLYANETLYTLDKVDAPETKLGAEVKVTGLLDEATNVIKVSSIEKIKKG